MNVKLSPSILSADFSKLGQDVRDAVDAGTEYIHVDVMDGHFVPNITIGPVIVEALRPIANKTGVVIDVHLMIEKPELMIPAFTKAGADIITVHVETSPHLHRTIQQIHELGAKAGVTLNPATPLSDIEEILPYIDMVLIMSVNPGFGGQSYIPTSTAKISHLRKMLDDIGRKNVDIEVDGGIKTHNAVAIIKAGANILVAGSAIFNDKKSIAQNIADFRKILGVSSLPHSRYESAKRQKPS